MFKTFDHFNISSIERAANHRLVQQTNKDNTTVITCYDGPPSVSGLPGIHHILSRTLKDIFCRYNMLQGHKVTNIAGWDTHGLPVELNIEKKLGITKKDIGTKISVAEYNKQCHDSIVELIDKWHEITEIHGYCSDITHPYITCDKRYIESEWWAFKALYDKGYIYSDYNIQPYSPAAGTGLSSHELSQPGCYKTIKDQTVTAMFKLCAEDDTFFLAWTTTPWTLPANSALAINKDVTYVTIACKNPYSQQEINVILAKDCIKNYFSSATQYTILQEYKGSELLGLKYEQLYSCVKPAGKAFEVIAGDYVTTEDGTGIVHIAPSFGGDDRRIAKENSISDITVIRDGKQVPIVDEQGKYVSEITPWAGRYVKQAYEPDNERHELSIDIEIVKDLKQRGLCFKSEKHEHSYPHCWRTDKPLIYYPLQAWFIKTTAVKERLIELNKKISWHPASTGIGRFHNWLENLVDWNVSRERFWGTPIPLWVSDDGKEIKCIGSFDELREEIMKANEILHLLQPTELKDIHKPYIDDVVLVSSNGHPMRRVGGVLDVWFDSGCMPFAQWHYPFENQEIFLKHFPADFIAEGVDQTRGWFFTLHVLATMLFDNIAYKNVISTGLVLDKNGEKMSKRLGNTIDPFELIKRYGADAVRWYIIINTNPWENIKFDVSGVEEVVKKFFITLFNTYNFFAMYYNASYKTLIDLTINKKIQNIDSWILSRLHNVIKTVNTNLDQYDPTKALRAINDFVIDDLSNWYVRINRKRFSKNDDPEDKSIVFSVLHECLHKISVFMYPFAPHFGEWLKNNISQEGSSQEEYNFPRHDDEIINVKLEETMNTVRDIISCVLALRKKGKIKVRQPLSKIIINTQQSIDDILQFRDIILSETNIKDIILTQDASIYNIQQPCGEMIIAIDTEITEELKLEGYVREFIKLVQNYRKENKFKVSDKIEITCFSDDEAITKAIRRFEHLICRELLCEKFIFEQTQQQQEAMIEDKKIYLHITSL